jgi:subtilisin family serine protease
MRRLSLPVLLAFAVSAHGAELRKVAHPIPGRYIVVLKPAALQAEGLTALSVSDLHVTRYGVKRTHVYRSALQGYAAALDDSQVQQLLQDESVAYIENDQLVHADTLQSGATWGLDRIDQRDLPLSGTYTYNFNGTGVHAYIIDTGIHASHVEFAGRVGNGFTAINDGNGTNDCAGHGTHVSGTVGGATYGVAKNVTLHPVRVLDCGGSGSNAGVIAGVDWVRMNHMNPAVANMSLGGGASSALDDAVNAAVASGVTFAVAAGNENTDACTKSPARAASAITVGATTSGDARASFSNFGTCVDIFAPGQGITSSWFTSNTATNTISGTSMATPHVCGVAALYLSQHGTTAPATVAAALNSAATLNHVTGAGSGSPNRLLYSLFAVTSPTPTPTPTPTLMPTPTPTPTTATPTPPGGMEIVPVAVVASADDGNVPANAIDNNLSTRWSANGDGQWLRLDFGVARDISSVRIAVYNGNSRSNRFELQTSNDGTTWVTSGGMRQSSGTTTQPERYPLSAHTRYVRYLGHGNTASTWNSVTEIHAFWEEGIPTPTPTSPSPTPTPTFLPPPSPTPTPTSVPNYVEAAPVAVSASTSDTNVAANAVDGSLLTRWSGSGDGASLELDLGSVRTLGHVTVAAYSGNTRRNMFDLQVATTSGAWMNVLVGAQTSGTTTQEEIFQFNDLPARWVRYVGHGNSDPTKGSWNSVTEISLFVAP